MPIKINPNGIVDRESIRDNASEYVFNVSERPIAPSISVDPLTVDSKGLDSAVEIYSAAAEKYQNDYTDFIKSRDVLKNRLCRDLAASTEFMTKDGIDLQGNKVTLHKKANDVFDYVTKGNVSDRYSIVKAIDEYGVINDRICMADAGPDGSSTGTAMTSEYEEIPSVYDDMAVSITSALEGNVDNGIFVSGITSAVFITDIPNAKGTEAKYTCYNTSGYEPAPASKVEAEPSTSGDTAQESPVASASGAVVRKVNTAKYTMAFENSISVSDSDPSGSKLVSSVWVIRNVSTESGVKGEPIAYSSKCENGDFTSSNWKKYEAPKNK